MDTDFPKSSEAPDCRGFMVILALLAVAFWLAHFFLYFQRKVPVGGEVDLLLTQEALYRTGSTSYRLDSLSPWHGGNYHPPLWWLLTQAIMNLGLGPADSIFVLNVASGVVTIAATWMLGYFLGRDGAKTALGPLSVLLLCTIPLFQVGTGIIDIDNGLLTAVMTVYLAVLLTGRGNMPQARFIVLGIVLGISLLTKLSTPLILIPVTHFYFWSKNGSLRKALVPSGVIVAVGVVTFALVYSITQPILGRDLYGPFAHNFAHLLVKSSGQDWEKWVHRLRTIAELQLWVGPPSAVILFAIVKRISSRFSETNAETTPLVALTIYVMGIWMVYAYLGVTFNLRYMIPSLPALAVISASFILEQGTISVQRCARGLRLVALGGLGLLLGAGLYLLPDPYLYLKTDLRYNFWPAAFSYIFVLSILAVMVYGGILGYARIGIERKDKTIAWLVCIWFAFNLNTSIKQMFGNYQLYYDYGFSEYHTVADWIARRVPADASVFAPKSLVWLLRERRDSLYFYSNLDRCGDGSKGEWSGRTCYVILARRYARSGEAWRERVLAGAEEVYRNRDFVVVRKS